MSQLILTGIPGGPELIASIPVLVITLVVYGLYQFIKSDMAAESEVTELDKSTDPYLKQEIEENVGEDK